MEARDLDVQVMADRVAISGERKSETKTEEDKDKTAEVSLSEGVYHMRSGIRGRTSSEFRYGKFALSNSSTCPHSKYQRYRRL